MRLCSRLEHRYPICCIKMHPAGPATGQILA
jgi:hypothetical protein